MTGPFERALLGLLPALGLLAALVYLDGYKLVRLRAVVALLACGAAIAAATYALNRLFLERFPLPLPLFSRYVAPVGEELLKALVVVALVRAHRIGFLVDAAICGFAVGTGFGVAENLYYVHLLPGAGPGLFLVRGFGTALMHGGATAIVGVLGLASLERRPDAWVRAFLPGLLLAVVLHSAFNHFFLSPLLSTSGIVLVLPILFQAIFARSERSLGEWIGRGFDADVATLELINSGRFAGSPAGRYLHALKDRFDGAGGRRPALLPAVAHRALAPRQGSPPDARERLRPPGRRSDARGIRRAAVSGEERRAHGAARHPAAAGDDRQGAVAAPHARPVAAVGSPRR